MYRVSIPIESSESRGAAQAEAVAALPNAGEEVAVTLLYAFDDDNGETDTAPRQIPGGSVASDRLHEAGIAVEQVSRVGDPAAGILGAAEEVDADRPVSVTGGGK